jgi:exopolyphosphatase/guanosine-5'-triphosphate,3'-diphosphate pyrophosphatase
LVAPWKQNAPILAIVFRLACLLHRNRHSELIDFKIEINQQKIDLEFSEQFFEQAPLTYADLKQEIDYLKDAGFSLSLN